MIAFLKRRWFLLSCALLAVAVTIGLLQQVRKQREMERLESLVIALNENDALEIANTFANTQGYKLSDFKGPTITYVSGKSAWTVFYERKQPMTPVHFAERKQPMKDDYNYIVVTVVDKTKACSVLEGI